MNRNYTRQSRTYRPMQLTRKRNAQLRGRSTTRSTSSAKRRRPLSHSNSDSEIRYTSKRPNIQKRHNYTVAKPIPAFPDLGFSGIKPMMWINGTPYDLELNKEIQSQSKLKRLDCTCDTDGRSWTKSISTQRRNLSPIQEVFGSPGLLEAVRHAIAMHDPSQHTSNVSTNGGTDTPTIESSAETTGTPQYGNGESTSSNSGQTTTNKKEKSKEGPYTSTTNGSS